MSFMFSIFPLMFAAVFCFVIGMFVYVFATMIRQNRRNDNSPRLTVSASVVAKRDHHSRNRDHLHTSYYVTFQFESGDRLELIVPGGEFGLLCEGDQGKLTFQGTRYLGFEREF
jgi:hypothetical protein